MPPLTQTEFCIQVPPSIKDLVMPRILDSSNYANGLRIQQQIKIAFYPTDNPASFSTCNLQLVKKASQSRGYNIFKAKNADMWFKSPVKLTEGNKRKMNIYAQALRMVLLYSGLTHLIDNVCACRMMVTEPQNVKTSEIALAMPHMGTTIDYLLRAVAVNEALMGWLYHVYSTGLEMAIKLLEENNIWVDDPNPGNIVVYPHDNTLDNDLVHIGIIDIHKKRQVAKNPQLTSHLKQRFAATMAKHGISRRRTIYPLK